MQKVMYRFAFLCVLYWNQSLRWLPSIYLVCSGKMLLQQFFITTRMIESHSSVMSWKLWGEGLKLLWQYFFYIFKIFINTQPFCEWKNFLFLSHKYFLRNFLSWFWVDWFKELRNDSHRTFKGLLFYGLESEVISFSQKPGSNGWPSLFFSMFASLCT